MTVLVESGTARVVALDGTTGLSREELGGKAWSINRMRALGLPVPPAIVATTDNCHAYYANGQQLPPELWQRILDGLRVLEQGTGRRFGSTDKPLLVSVRSGAARSMPGMMDTVLDLGINSEIEAALAAESGDPEYAADTHHRFREAYRQVVLGDMNGTVPADPWRQLRGAVEAVFASWNSPRAQAYRRNRGLGDEGGTAVTVQAMVFGNLDDRSGTGVLFTRDPRTGEHEPFGEWLPRGQGEDVVSGRSDPQPLQALADLLPDVHAQLMTVATRLERDSGDIQDIEFTVESGRLWLLQSRTAKRSPRAAVRAAVAMVEEGLLEPRQALARVSAEQVRAMLMPTLDRSGLTESQPAATGLPVCEGVARGLVVVDPDEAERRAEAGEDVILARVTTSPDDMHGVIAARAVVTEHGGSTSHAAVVSRELGRVCVVGCGVGSVTSLAGQRVTVDGGTGEVWLGEIPLLRVDEAHDRDLARLTGWAQSQVPRAVRDHLASLSDPQLPLLLDALCRETKQPSPADHEKLSTATVSESSPVDEITELGVLRLIVLKGRTDTEVLADCLRVQPCDLEPVVGDLVDRGSVKTGGTGLRPAAAGRARCAELVAAEAAATDAVSAAELYARFCALNDEFKTIITDWQMRDVTTLNDHADPDYDRGVLTALTDLYRRAQPLIDDLATLSTRLRHYRHRFAQAHARVTGDHSFVAAIGKDSFHTIWFELHEDLIGITGKTRGDEAAAGRAL
ncbi:pyruvate, phosphate dikinase [Nocardia sp. NPDC052112]|uniref:pyruvate, phosphate dikinase n=1 Tax=Nocardia sp. NPDC052112 TaxID=3155646 RepID=UPI00342934D3